MITKPLSIYDRSVIAQVLDMAEGRISLNGYGAWSLRTGKRLASFGKDVLSQQGRDFIKRRCRPFTVKEMERQLAQKTRNLARLTHMIHVATDSGRFEKAAKLANKAHNENDRLTDAREKMARNKTSFYVLSGASRTAFTVHQVKMRLLGVA